eukprot:scaffold110628_cov30-Tisochrysis_lutea.AAC.1
MNPAQSCGDKQADPILQAAHESLPTPIVSLSQLNLALKTPRVEASPWRPPAQHPRQLAVPWQWLSPAAELQEALRRKDAQKAPPAEPKRRDWASLEAASLDADGLWAHSTTLYKRMTMPRICRSAE